MGANPYQSPFGRISFAGWKSHMYAEIFPSWLNCGLSLADDMFIFFQQIAKLRLQLQRSKQGSRQSKDREQSSLQLLQQAQHGTACMPQVSYSCQ